MTTYVALLRGIMPMNPNMKGEKLKGVFESLGFKNVATVIASGNVVFQSESRSAAELETLIEKALPEQLGFNSMTILRTKDELLRLVKKDPFKGVEDRKPNYLIVSFIKGKKAEVCTVLNLDTTGTPEFMKDIEKKYDKKVTTRTWKTIARILAKMEAL